MTTTQQDESLELLKEYAAGKYAEVTDACAQATAKINKGLHSLAEESEKEDPEDIISKI